MATLAGFVHDVEMQRRRVLGQLSERGTARERRARRQQFGERDRRQDAGATADTRRHRRGLEPFGTHEQSLDLVGIQTDRLGVRVEHRQLRPRATRVTSLGYHGRQRRPRAPVSTERAQTPRAYGEVMRAVVSPGNNEITVEERPTPEPGDGEVRVKVHGAGLNRADLLQKAGLYPPPPGVPVDIPGMEFAGTIDAVGPSATDLASGDAVWGIVGGGAQAEYLVTRADQCARVPDGLDLVAAGGVPEVFVTAHDAMFSQAELAPGQRVLVHAAGSGVGTAVIQLARASDCEIVGTARTADKLERARALGLDHGVLVESPFDALAVAQKITEAAGPIDVVLDLVGGDYLSVDTTVAADRGRIVLIGTMAGAQATLAILSVMSKRLRIYGTVMRPRSLDEKAAATSAFAAATSAWFVDETVAPVVDQVMPLAEASDAYDLLASDTTFGKVILAP